MGALFCVSVLWAQSDIASKIRKLQTLPQSERYKMINEIKRDLAKLNTQQRAQMIRKLRETIKGEVKERDRFTAERREKGAHGGWKENREEIKRNFQSKRKGMDRQKKHNDHPRKPQQTPQHNRN